MLTTGTSTPSTFIGQTSREYHYRVRTCDASGCDGSSAIKMVLANRPPTVGFDNTYIIRTDNFGSENATDIYLSPLAVGTGNIGEFILKNDGGTFALENNPSVTELASAQSWSVSTSLEIALEDVNVDGVWDALVTGISGASGFGGAVDQIVVGPASAGGKPTGLVAVDSDLKSFINSVMAWYKNLNHFDKPFAVGSEIIFGGSTTAAGGLKQLAECRLLWGSCFQVLGSLADHYGSYDVCVSTVFSHGANGWQACADGWHVHAFVRLTRQITRPDFAGLPYEVSEFVRIWSAGEASHEVEDLADVLEDLLDITISGTNGERIGEVQQALFNLYALIGAQGRRNDDVPANKVIVTRRRVVETESKWKINNLNWHAALEWTIFESDPAWLAGNPTIAAYQRKGKLKSERNHPSERNNLFSGTVSATGLPETVSIWLTLSDAERRYHSCPPLSYPWPGVNLLSQYNSNGFIAGIIRSIGGTTNAPVHTYYLGNRPVPISNFQTYCP